MFASVPEGLASLVVGLVGVVLARWVFVNREERRLGARAPVRETLPLTLVSILVAGVLIHDRQMGFSAAAFTGLGVGWAAVVLLDIFGERIISTLKGNMSAGPYDSRFPSAADHSGKDGKMDSPMVDLPPDMVHRLDEIERKDSDK